MLAVTRNSLYKVNISKDMVRQTHTKRSVVLYSIVARGGMSVAYSMLLPENRTKVVDTGCSGPVS